MGWDEVDKSWRKNKSRGLLPSRHSSPDFRSNVEISSAVTFGDLNIPNQNRTGFDVDVDLDKLPNIARERYKVFSIGDGVY